MTAQRSLLRIVNLVVLAAIVAGLAGCVTATPYQPAAPRGFGYSEERLDQNRYRVAFRGNAMTARETVEDYLLYRAAELTLQNSFTHFLVVGRDTEAKTSYRYWIDDYGGRGWFYHGFPGWYRSPWNRPWGMYDVQPITTYTATAEVVMFKGPREEGEVKTFDAREVLAAVGPRVIRPEDLEKR
jgi:hypothetical protein